jgi:hypothetical protein
MAKKRKKDLTAELTAIRQKLNQDSADTVARMARLKTEITERLDGLTEAVAEQSQRTDKAIGAIIDLVVDFESDVRTELDEIKARLERLENPAA